jgi:sugar-specific transcriptional regulator TrmB
MSRLVSKGLVEETADRPKRYRASNPQSALKNLAKQTTGRLRRITVATEQLAARFSELTDTSERRKGPEVRVIDKIDNIQRNFLGMVASAEREIWMMAGRKQVLHAPTHTVSQTLRTISKKNLRARLIAELDQNVARHLKKHINLVEIRHCGNVPVHLYGVDDSAVSVGLTPSSSPDSQSVSEIRITHPETVRVMRNFFETFWDQAVPFNVWTSTREEDRGTQHRRTVIWGREQLFAAVADWHLKARERILDYMPAENGPVRVLTYLKESFTEARNRGVRMQSLCHITPRNLAAVRQMLRFTEVRHTDASPGIGFGILDESEAVIQYIQADTSDIICPTDIAIYVTDESAVRQLGEMFNLLWKNSIPAESKIRELSETMTHKSTTQKI